MYSGTTEIPTAIIALVRLAPSTDTIESASRIDGNESRMSTKTLTSMSVLPLP